MSTINFSNAARVFQNNEEVTEIYLGNVLVWRKTNPAIISAVINKLDNILSVDVVVHGTPTPNISYRWRINGVDQGNEISNEFEMIGDHTGNTISCMIEVSNSEGVARVVPSTYIS